MNIFRYGMGVLGLVLWAVAQPVPALGQAEFVVDTEVDAVDTNPGDGICETADGECTLRAAIQESNELSGEYAVSVPEGRYVLSIPGRTEDDSGTGDLDIRSTITISGSGPSGTIIDGAKLDRVFHVLEIGRLEITGLTITNGSASEDGGFSGEGGGIWNQGSLSTQDIDIIDNFGAFSGGGLANPGSATLRNTRILRNSSPNGGAIGNSPGSEGNTLELIDSLVEANMDSHAGSHGGISAGTANIQLIRTSIIGNEGTGIFVGNSRQLLITDSTIANNGTLGGVGGGIFTTEATMRITNSTISGNSTTANGGGILGGGTLNMSNVTMVNNVADADGDGIGHGAAIYWTGGTIEAKNSIIASNTVADGSGLECYGGLTSIGHNLFGSTNCTDPVSSDIVTSQPLIAPLADNGGPTMTHALLEGSPAIDAGDPAPTGSGGTSCEATDQRSVSRPRANACDIGAFESDLAQTPPTPTPQQLPELGAGPPQSGARPAATIPVGIGGLVLAIGGSLLVRFAVRRRVSGP